MDTLFLELNRQLARHTPRRHPEHKVTDNCSTGRIQPQVGTTCSLIMEMDTMEMEMDTTEMEMDTTEVEMEVKFFIQ